LNISKTENHYFFLAAITASFSFIQQQLLNKPKSFLPQRGSLLLTSLPPTVTKTSLSRWQERRLKHRILILVFHDRLEAFHNHA